MNMMKEFNNLQFPQLFSSVFITDYYIFYSALL